jgi:phage/plasmid-like protein (TIGR03299 family)
MNPIFNLFSRVDQCRTAEDILNEGGLNYRVEKQPHSITIRGEDIGDMQTIVNPFTVSVFRPDISKIIGTVGIDYGLIQNDEVLEFCNIFTERGEAEFYAAVAPNNGERIYVLMKQPKSIDLGVDNTIQAYFCIISSHDGTGCFRARPIYVHTRSNTLITPPAKGSAFRIKHSKRVTENMKKARIVLQTFTDYWREYTDNFRDFATCKITDDQAQTYFKMLFPNEESTRSENIRERLFNLYKSNGISCNIASCKETLFGAMMAVVENADFYQTVKSSRLKSENAVLIHSRLEGSAAELKARAISASVRMHDMFKKGGSWLRKSTSL